MHDISSIKRCSNTQVWCRLSSFRFKKSLCVEARITWRKFLTNYRHRKTAPTNGYLLSLLNRSLSYAVIVWYNVINFQKITRTKNLQYLIRRSIKSNCVNEAIFVMTHIRCQATRSLGAYVGETPHLSLPLSPVTSFF